MEESEGIQEMVNQPAVHAVMAVMMVLRDADAGSQLAPTTSPIEPQR